MKTKILAVIICAVTVVSVYVNTYFLDAVIGEIEGAVEALEISENNMSDSLMDAREIQGLWERRETFMSLSVSHKDITDVGAILAELVGQLEVGNTDDAKVTKYRLTDALGHMRRLSGINIDSII